MLKVVVIFLAVSHSVPLSVVPYTVPTKVLNTEDANEPSNGSSINLLRLVGVMDTEDPGSLFSPY